MKMPVLFAANAHAVFELADTLGSSERDYLKFKELDHNDSICQGVFKRLLATWPEDGKDAGRPAAKPGSAEASYEALCGYVVAFLDARLRGDSSRQQALDATYRSSALGGDVPHVEHVPAGVTAARPYRNDAGKPSEPRQVRGFVKELGSQACVAILKAAHAKTPDAPVFDESVGFARIDELLPKGRTQDAIAFHRLYGTFDPKFLNRHTKVGKSLLGYGMKTQALDYFQKAVRLNPDDVEAAGQVKALRQALKTP